MLSIYSEQPDEILRGIGGFATRQPVMSARTVGKPCIIVGFACGRVIVGQIVLTVEPTRCLTGCLDGAQAVWHRELDVPEGEIVHLRTGRKRLGNNLALRISIIHSNRIPDREDAGLATLH
jgi:hypothetical protein